MFGVIAKNQKETFAGYRFKKRDDNEGEYFEFYFSNHFRFDENFPITGLKTKTGYTEITTSWEIDFEEDQFIEIDGTMWRIDKIILNPNANRAFVNRIAVNPTAEYILALNKVANPKAVKRE